MAKKKPQKLTRSSKEKMVAGIAGGIGEYFNIDPTIIRLLFILTTIFSGAGIIVYIVLWIVVPEE